MNDFPSRDRKQRPVFLDLRRIHLPVTALLSIGHRVSGLLLFIFLPVLIYAFDISLRGEEGFVRVREWLNSLPVRLLILLGLWALAHHLLAGVRFLFLDLGLGERRPVARASARAVLGLEALAVLMAAMLLFFL